MAVGYEVINDSGSILLDANYLNLALIAKGTIDIGRNTNQGGSSGQVTVPATGPNMVFIRSSGFAAVTLSADGWFNYFLGFGATRFDYWVFAPPRDIGAKYGMQVYTEDGILAFDASQRYLRIIGSMNISSGTTLPTQNGNEKIVSLPLPAGLPAVCLSDPGFQMQVLTGSGVSGGVSYRTTTLCASRIVDGNLQVAQVLSNNNVDLPSNVTVNSTTSSLARSVILADVSGF